jgi:hypothetical protein
MVGAQQSDYSDEALGGPQPDGGWPRDLSAVGESADAIRPLCDELRHFAIQVRQLAYLVQGGIGERECLDLSQRMLAAAEQAEARMAG